MRKVTRALVVAAGSAALVLGGASAALAGNPGSSSPNSSTPGHFTYTDAFLGPVDCNEVHHPSNILPSAITALYPTTFTTGGYDTVNCKMANPSHAGQNALDYWISDFGTQFDHNVGYIQVHYDGSGSHEIGVAWYPNG